MSPSGGLYEQLRALIIWLGLVELGWTGYWLLGPPSPPPGFVGTVVVWIVAMLAWMVLVIYLGRHGAFLRHTQRLSNLLGFFLVLALPAVLFASIDGAREGVVRAALHTSNFQLALIHVLRLLAIGGIIKYMQGELPRHFVILAAIPDFLFAVSAVVVTAFEATAPLSSTFLLVWHAVGFVVFFGPGFSMFLSVPSPFRIYHDKPDASIVFQFPMVLAPNYTVPLFALAHIFAMMKLLAI